MAEYAVKVPGDWRVYENLLRNSSLCVFWIILACWEKKKNVLGKREERRERNIKNCDDIQDSILSHDPEVRIDAGWRFAPRLTGHH